MLATTKFQYAVKQVDRECARKGGACIDRPAMARGNYAVTAINTISAENYDLIKTRAPRCKNKFVNSLGNAASRMCTSRRVYPMIYRFIMDVFGIDCVQHVRADRLADIKIVLNYMIENIDRCWWPTAFFDNKVSENKDTLVNEWLYNMDVNPYFKLVEEAKALINA